jgi:transposase
MLHLEWLTELPWRIEAEPQIDIATARRVLDEDLIPTDRTADSNVNRCDAARYDSPSLPGKGMAMTVAITRLDLSATDLRDAAAQTQDAKAARRMLAIALVLEGWSREAAAAACAMDRQTLRDWVHRYNELGLEGLFDQPRRNSPRPRLSAEQQTIVADWVAQGPDLERDGVVRWRCVDLQLRIAQEFAVQLHERTVGKRRAADL